MSQTKTRQYPFEPFSRSQVKSSERGQVIVEYKASDPSDGKSLVKEREITQLTHNGVMWHLTPAIDLRLS